MIARFSFNRRGMTLVELLVVMVIILILGTIVVAFAPAFQDAQKVPRGADQLQGWLLTARQWAKKDRVPTGIRLSATNGFVTDLQYVQQPSTFMVPYATPAQSSGQQPNSRRISIATSGANTVAALDMTWNASPQVAGQLQGDFSGGLGMTSLATKAAFWPVQSGDYLVLHQAIYSVTGFNSATPPFCDQITLGSPLPTGISSIPATNDYYFVRGPRPFTGETTLKLPQDVAIDLSQSDPSTTATTEFDILFSPSGEVLAPVFGSTKGGKVILWVLDMTKPAGNKADTLIAIDMRTGLIGAQPINTDPSLGGPFYYTTDGRSSGL